MNRTMAEFCMAPPMCSLQCERIAIMGKFVAGWVLGVPLMATVLLYVIYS